MGRLVAILVCLWLPLAAHAATIRGSVVIQEGSASKPAGGVGVMLWSEPRSAELTIGGRWTSTGPDGQFSFPVNETGSQYLRVIYAKGQYADYVFPRDYVKVVVEATGDPQPVRFVIRLGATVVGRVVNEKGQPMAWAMAGVEGAPSGEFDRTTGRFTVRGVLTGQARQVKVAPVRPSEYSYTRFVAVSAEKLLPGAQVDVGDVQFQPVPKHANFRGTFCDSEGQLLSGYPLFFMSHRDQPVQFIVPAPGGRFERALLPGTYNATSRENGPSLGTYKIEADRVTEAQIKLLPRPAADTRPAESQKDGQ